MTLPPTLPVPPWKAASLEAYCQRVNDAKGQRAKKYHELLRHLKKSSVTAGSWDLLSRNVLVILHHIPSEVVRREALQKTLQAVVGKFCYPGVASRDRLGSLDAFCSLINQSSRIGTRGYVAILGSLISSGVPPDQRCSYLEATVQRMPEKVLKRLESSIQILRDEDKSAVARFFQLKTALVRSATYPEALSIDLKIEKLVKELPREVIDPVHSLAINKTLTLRFKEELRLKKRKIYPILSIDGGGIRGIIPAKVLVAIEKVASTSISQMFQLIGGTSTGGILALGLTKPHETRPTEPAYRAQDLLDLYTTRHKEVFRANPAYRPDTSALSWQEQVREAIYNPKYLKPALFQERFAGAYLSSALTDVLITANSVDAIVQRTLSFAVNSTVSFVKLCFGRAPVSYDTKTTHVFTKRGMIGYSYSLNSLMEYDKRKRDESLIYGYRGHVVEKGDFPMDYVTQVTSAAPTYFPPVVDKWVDGGVLQNNPAIPCLFEAMEQGQRLEDMFMLSLGTGDEASEAPPRELSDLTMKLWFDTIQPHWDQDCVVDDLLSGGASYRFQPRFSGIARGLDDTTPASIAELEDFGDALVDEKRDQIREICRLLSPATM